MSKFKALLYREFIISRKTFFLQLISTLATMFFFWIMVMSMKFGNLKFDFFGSNPTVEDISSGCMMLMIMMYSIGFIIAFISTRINITNTVTADIDTNWRTFAFTLPVSGTEKALVELLVKVLNIILSLIITFVNFIFLSSVLEIGLDVGFVFKVWSVILLISTIMDFFTLPVLHAARTKSESKFGTFLSTFILILMAVILIFIVRLPNDETKIIKMDTDKLNLAENINIQSGVITIPVESSVFANMADILDVLGAVAIPIIITLLIGGFFFSKRTMERRYD